MKPTSPLGKFLNSKEVLEITVKYYFALLETHTEVRGSNPDSGKCCFPEESKAYFDGRLKHSFNHSFLSNCIKEHLLSNKTEQLKKVEKLSLTLHNFANTIVQDESQILSTNRTPNKYCPSKKTPTLFYSSVPLQLITGRKVRILHAFYIF